MIISNLRLSLASLLTSPPMRDSFGSLEGGLRRTYREGRRAMNEALQHGTAGRFHEWRKHVKTLWYQTQLLRNVAPELLKPHRDLLNQLGKALGEHHDVHVLEAFISTRRSRRKEGVREVLSQRLAEIEQRAIALGQQLYAEKSNAFTTRMQRLWQTFRPESSQPATEAPEQETIT
jgi:CHAD domain-containing protein